MPDKNDLKKKGFIFLAIAEISGHHNKESVAQHSSPHHGDGGQGVLGEENMPTVGGFSLSVLADILRGEPYWSHRHFLS